MANRALLASVALFSLSVTTGARAADQSAVPRLPTKTQIVPPAPSYNWTGCYIGAHGGGGAVSDTFVASGELGNPNFQHGGNAFAGGQIGCNIQNGVMVLGLEVEAWSSLTNPSGNQNPFTANPLDHNRWSGDVAVRAGLAFDRALLYGKAGVAEGRFAFSATNTTGDFENGATALTGALLGVGLEYGVAPNWSAKVEYDHIEYAGRVVHFDADARFGGPFDQTVSASVNLIKAGINYRFGGPSLTAVSAHSQPFITKALPSKTPASAAFASTSSSAASSSVSWTGCYAGVHGGGGWMVDTNFIGAFEGTSGGGLAGGQLGCNVQTGAIVWGVEGEAAWSGLTAHFHFDDSAVNLSDSARNRWSADVAARAGIAVDRALVYGKAGLAAGRFQFSSDLPAEFANGSATLAGLLFGAGVEYAVAPNWSVKLEYDHINYFGRNVSFNDSFSGPFVESEAATTDVVKLGVNYRFAGSSFGDLPFAPAADRAAPSAALLKAPALKMPVSADNWTGCYAGIHGGGGVLADSFTHSFVAPGVPSPGIGDNDTNAVPLSSGGFAGGQLGCDYQTGALVVGLQGEAAWSRLINHFNSTAEFEGGDVSTDLVWSAAGAARAGVAIDRGLIYGKAGLAASRFEFSGREFFANQATFFEHGSTALTGLLLGGGIEYALAPNWSVLLEYNRIAYGGRVVHFVTPFDQTESAIVNEVKAGVNYRFGSATLPPVRGGSQNLLPPPAIDWTGCYAGVHAGGGIIDDAFVLPTFIEQAESSSGGGALAGAQTGCNVQTGIMVFGLESEAAWSNLTNRIGFNFSQGVRRRRATATAGVPTSRRAPASPSTARSSTAKLAWRLGGSVF